MGRVLVRYDNWSSGKPVQRYAITLPWQTQAKPIETIIGLTVEGQYVFAVEPVGAVHVFDKDSGKEVGVIRPGPEVGNASGWVDVPNGISAYSAQQWRIPRVRRGGRTRQGDDVPLEAGLMSHWPEVKRDIRHGAKSPIVHRACELFFCRLMGNGTHFLRALLEADFWAHRARALQGKRMAKRRTLLNQKASDGQRHSQERSDQFLRAGAADLRFARHGAVVYPAAGRRALRRDRSCVDPDRLLLDSRSRHEHGRAKPHLEGARLERLGRKRPRVLECDVAQSGDGHDRRPDYLFWRFSLHRVFHQGVTGIAA